MVSIILIAHTPLAAALKAVVEHVLGPVELFTAIDIFPDQCAANYAQTMSNLITEADAGEGVLILTDLPGASPSNICISAAEYARAQGVPCIVLSGVNPGMLLRAINYRQVALDAVASQAMIGANQSTMRVD
jgi:PTS system ascorbate-specific IIA component